MRPLQSWRHFKVQPSFFARNFGLVHPVALLARFRPDLTSRLSERATNFDAIPSGAEVHGRASNRRSGPAAEIAEFLIPIVI